MGATKIDNKDKMSSLETLREGFRVFWTGKTDKLKITTNSSEGESGEATGVARTSSSSGERKYPKFGLSLPGRIWHLVQDKETSKVRARLRGVEDFQEIIVRPGMMKDHRSHHVLSIMKLRCEQQRDKVS